MARLDWMNDKDLTSGKVLQMFLSSVSDEQCKYSEKASPNSLEYALYEIIIGTTESNDGVSILDLMMLDELDIVGDTLVKLWELCEKDKDYFKKTISYITGNMLRKVFTEDEIRNNLALEKPIPFIPKSDEVPFLFKLSPYKDKESYDKLIFALRKNLVIEYNKKVRETNNHNLIKLPLPELVKKDDKPSIPDETILNLNDLYFGQVIIDLTGGVLGLNMSTYGIFEKQKNMVKVDGKVCYVVRSIPEGEYSIMDEFGNLVEHNQQIEVAGVSILPTKAVQSLAIAKVTKYLREAEERDVCKNIVRKYNDQMGNLLTVANYKTLLDDMTQIHINLYGGLENNQKGLK